MSKTGFIYKLAHNDPEIKEIYVGSTNNLRVRKNNHKSSCNNKDSRNYNLNVYQFIRSNGGFSNFNIFQIEEVKYNIKYELHARERYYIELLNPSLNKVIPNRTQQEYNEDNKEKINERQKQYYEEHKEQALNYREEHKEHYKNLNKKWREEHQHERKEYYNEYDNNRREKRCEKNNCDCGGKYTNQGKSRHLKSQLHQSYFTRLSNPEIIDDVQPSETNLAT